MAAGLEVDNVRRIFPHLQPVGLRRDGEVAVGRGEGQRPLLFDFQARPRGAAIGFEFDKFRGHAGQQRPLQGHLRR